MTNVESKVPKKCKTLHMLGRVRIYRPIYSSVFLPTLRSDRIALFE